MIINGKEIAHQLNTISQQRVATLRQCGIQPTLAVILIGDDPASRIYTRNKHRLATRIGMRSIIYHFKQDVSQDLVLTKIRQLNQNDEVDAILVQEPLPPHLDGQQLINEIDPRKDVDGLHPLNLGKLYAHQAGHYPVACTPGGIMRLLDQYQVPLAGANVVVVGRSILVGKPLFALLNNRNATVTLVGRHTRDFATVTRRADILIVAAGVRGLVKAKNIKQGAVVIDVGIHRLATGKLAGDVDFPAVADKASLITPVPGGVGPMTIASLLAQSINLACWRQNIRLTKSALVG